MRIYKDFRFEAAHYLPGETSSVNSRIHGHSLCVYSYSQTLQSL